MGILIAQPLPLPMGVTEAFWVLRWRVLGFVGYGWSGGVDKRWRGAGQAGCWEVDSK